MFDRRGLSQTKILIGFLVLSALAWPARSEELAPDTGDDVTVLYIRGANPGFRDVSPGELGEEHQFDRQAIENVSPLTTDEFLRQVPGFTLFRRSSSLVSHPTTHGVSLRGLGASGASRTLVLLDGVPVNDPFGGWVPWRRIPLEGVEEIRVRENWGSTHFSLLGLGSVIEVQTLEPLPPRRMAKVLGGTQGTRLAHMYAGEGRRNFSASVGAELFETDGYRVIASEDRGAIDIAARARHALGYGKITFEPASGDQWHLLWNVFREERGNGTPLTQNESSSALLSLGGQTRTRQGDTFRFDAFGIVGDFSSTFSSQAEDRSAETPALDQFDVPVEQIGALMDWSTGRPERHYLEIGADVLWRSGETHEDFRYIDGRFERRRRAGAQQLLTGAYVFGRMQAAPRLTFDTLFRVNAWQNTVLFRNEKSLLDDSPLRIETFDDSTNIRLEPRFQVAYQATEHSTLRSSIFYGARAPSINELVRPFRVRNDITEANPELREEKVLGYDVDYRYTSRAFEVSITPFVNWMREGITNVTIAAGPKEIEPCGFVPEGGVCRQRANVDEAVTGGAEVSAKFFLNEHLAVQAAYLYTGSEITDSGVWRDLDGKSLAQLPQHQALLGAELEQGPVRGFVQARYIGEQYENDLNTLELSDYISIDASVALQVGPKTELHITGENITGNRYEVGKTAEGVETIGPPAILLAGVRIHF